VNDPVVLLNARADRLSDGFLILLAGAIALSNPDPIPHLFEDSNASAFMAGISEICEKHQYGLTVLPPVQDISRLTKLVTASLT
jgi:hypothetical protein